MVNFGKKLMVDQVEEWKGYYINYKLMKKMLKQYVEQTQHGGKDREHVLKEFSRILDDQIERLYFFYYNNKAILPVGLRNWENNALLFWNSMIYHKFLSYVMHTEKLGLIL